MKKVPSPIPSLALSLLALLAPGPDQSAKATEYTVEMTSDWTFSPDYLEIQVGDIVTWVNHDDFFGEEHDSVCPGYWDTGLLEVDDSASVMFLATGTYDYWDSTFYLVNMTGTIVVNPATPPEPTPATLLDPTQLPGGAFQFTLSNLVVGASYVIQASTNLLDWSSLATNTASSTVETYVDNGAGEFKQRFYRSWHLP